MILSDIKIDSRSTLQNLCEVGTLKWRQFGSNECTDEWRGNQNTKDLRAEDTSKPAHTCTVRYSLLFYVISASHVPGTGLK